MCPKFSIKCPSYVSSPPTVSKAKIPLFDRPNPRPLGLREFRRHMDSKLKGAAYLASSARGATRMEEARAGIYESSQRSCNKPGPSSSKRRASPTGPSSQNNRKQRDCLTAALARALAPHACISTEDP
jgi:hypothetical protein